MPDSQKPSSAKAAVAAARVRGEHGHFIKKTSSSPNSPNLPNHPKLLHLEENKTQNDETLIDVKVTNPLRRISNILEQIKRRQATVIDFKFTIPLIALPVFMLVAFSLGKSGGLAACGDNTQTKLGIIYMLKASAGAEDTLFQKTLKILTPLISLISPTSLTNTQTSRTILIQRDNTALTIENPKNLPLASYQTRQVFVTGKVNTCKNTIGVDNDSDVQLLP